jgi:hypothetical protein
LSGLKNIELDFNATYINLSTIKLMSMHQLKMAIKGSQWILKIGENNIYQNVLALRTKGYLLSLFSID